VSGGVNVMLGVPVWMQLVHLFLADLLWIAYVFASAQALQVSEATASRLSPSR
jgi:heme A synthase